VLSVESTSPPHSISIHFEDEVEIKRNAMRFFFCVPFAFNVMACGNFLHIKLSFSLYAMCFLRLRRCSFFLYFLWGGFSFLVDGFLSAIPNGIKTFFSSSFPPLFLFSIYETIR